MSSLKLGDTKPKLLQSQIAEVGLGQKEKEKEKGAGSLASGSQLLAQHLAYLSELIYSSLWPCVYSQGEKNLSVITPAQIQKRAGSILDGLLGVWLAGSRYRLI